VIVSVDVSSSNHGQSFGKLATWMYGFIYNCLHDLATNRIGVIYSRLRHINNFTSTSIFITEDGDIHRVGR
jgi:hypothetical protein